MQADFATHRSTRYRTPVAHSRSALVWVCPSGGQASGTRSGECGCGPTRAGHLVKMVHNRIEADAETAPLADPESYRYHLDLAEILSAMCEEFGGHIEQGSPR